MAGFFRDITASTFLDLLGEYSTVGLIGYVGGLPGSNQTISRGTFGGTFTITPSPANNGTTISDSQVQAELLAQVSAGILPAPVVDAAGNPNTVYMIYFPHGKTITQGGSNSCQGGGFCAYHGTIAGSVQLKPLLYGVFPDMQAGSGCDTGCGSSSTTFGNSTAVSSHELAEAITDSDFGLSTQEAPPLAWYDNVNGEIGDICNAQQAQVVANGFSYTVQKVFSNAAHDCIAGPHFGLSAPPAATPGGSFNADFTTSPTYAGTATFTSSDPTALLPADITPSGGGFHFLPVTLNTLGLQTVTVTDTSNAALTASVTVNVTSQITNQTTTTLASSLNPAGLGSSFSIASQVQSAGGVPSGIVTFTIDGTTFAQTPVDASGQALMPATSLTVGTHTIKAVYGGSSSFLSSAASLNQVITKASTRTSISSTPDPSTHGQRVTLTSHVNGGPAPTGIVTFLNGSFAIGSAPVTGIGVASLSTVFNVGSFSLKAQYSGDANHTGSTSTVLVQQVH